MLFGIIEIMGKPTKRLQEGADLYICKPDTLQ